MRPHSPLLWPGLCWNWVEVKGEDDSEEEEEEDKRIGERRGRGEGGEEEWKTAERARQWRKMNTGE